MSSLKMLLAFTLSLMVFYQVVLSQNAMAQASAAELQQKKEQLEKSIEYAEVLLNDTRLKKTAGLEELALLQKKIDARHEIVATGRALHEQLFDTIVRSLIAIDSIDTQLDHLKTEYAAMIRSAFLNRNQHQRILFLFAAESFGQAINRMNYYHIYATKRRKQASEIALTQNQLIEKAAQTEDQIDDNYLMLQHLDTEYALMKEEMEQKKVMIALLQRDEKQLINWQRKSQSDAAALYRSILETFATPPQNPDPQAEQLLERPAPSTQLLPGSFASQQGKLPWPVATGLIIQPFGEHQHPDLKNIKIKNDGVDFLTQSNTTARAVFDGQVTRVMRAAANTWAVIIRHGEFLTVYANLQQVFVKEGEPVTAMQNLGVISTEKEATHTLLHFEVWRGKDLTDPMQWLVSDQKITISATGNER